MTSRQMTVLQIVPALETGGAERTAVDVSKALVESGHNSIIASAGGRMAAEITETGGEHVQIPLTARDPVTILINARRIAALARDHRVDIIHARSRAPAWSALLASRITGIPWVTTYHGIYSESGQLKRLYNSVMARSDAIVANSNYTADLIVERYGTDRKRISVIYRGTDLSRFRPDSISTKRKTALREKWSIGVRQRVVLNVARLTGWKGQEVLIEAACRGQLAERENLVFILAGDDQGRGQYRSQLETLAERLGAGSRIRLVGHCDDVPAALAIADVSVVASTLPEAFGRAAVESQALGVPVVVTRLGAAPETVLAPPEVAEGARTGWHVPAGDADALGKAIDRALSLTPAEIESLAVRARAQAEKFSLISMTDRTLALYRSLAGT